MKFINLIYSNLIGQFILVMVQVLLFYSQIEDAEAEFLGFTISSTSIFGLSFLFASFIIFLVQERDTKVLTFYLTDTYRLLSLFLIQAKHLQFVSGVQASSYWLATFAWDLVNALIPAILTVTLFAAFQIDGYKGENIGAIFLLVVHYLYFKR